MRASVAATVAVVCAVAVALWLLERKQCAAAAAELAQLRVSFQPTAVAAVLAPALGALSAGFVPSVYELHLSSGTSRAMRCSALEDEAAPWLAYVARLHASIAVPASRWRTLHERSPKLVPRALVAGGGPAGLSAALVAHREGAAVTIVEQRTRRSRPVWFDLAPNASAVGGGASSDPPTTSTQSLLRDWGLFELTTEVRDGHDAGLATAMRVVPDERGSGVVTIQCHVLERFLELCCRLLGITMIYDRAYAHACFHPQSGTPQALLTSKPNAATSTPAAISVPPVDEPQQLPPCQPLGDSSEDALQPFDMLIGADGPRSAVRHSLGIGFPEGSSFVTADGLLARSADEIGQVSLIVVFALDADGRCPSPRREAGSDSFALAPHEIDEPGVSAVFKRLFAPYCELQILFERSLGDRVLADFARHAPASSLTHRPGDELGDGGEGGEGEGHSIEEEFLSLSRALPLSLLLRVCQRVLSDRIPADERAMVQMLRRGSGPHAPPDATVFRIAIRRAEAAGRVLLGRDGHAALAVLRGDALITPHYRLGIGINFAFDTLTHVNALITGAWGRGGRAALTGGSTSNLLEQWERGAGSDAHALSDYQLGVIYVEAVCGLLVFGGRVFERSRGRRELRELGAREISALDCTQILQ